MPWCAECDRFYNPNTLQPDGTCPTCGRQVADPTASTSTATVTAAPEKLRRFSDEPAPWHFKVLVAATVIYLAFRLFQGILWLV